MEVRSQKKRKEIIWKLKVFANVSWHELYKHSKKVSLEVFTKIYKKTLQKLVVSKMK